MDGSHTLHTPDSAASMRLKWRTLAGGAAVGVEVGREAGWDDTGEADRGEEEEEEVVVEEEEVTDCNGAELEYGAWLIDCVSCREPFVVDRTTALVAIEAVLGGDCSGGGVAVDVGSGSAGLRSTSALACPDTTARRCAFFARSLARSAADFSARSWAADTAGTALVEPASSVPAADMISLQQHREPCTRTDTPNGQANVSSTG